MFEKFVKILNKAKNKLGNFAKLESIILVSTFFCLWLAVIFEDTFENYIAYLFILSFGILHGANDLTLIQKEKTTQPNPKSYLTILVLYITFVLGSVLVFYVLPSLALLVFILFSGYHFGEQHLVGKTNNSSMATSILFFTYGIFILFLLFFINYAMTAGIIETMIGFVIPKLVFKIVLSLSGISTICLALFLVLKKKITINPIKELFFLGVFFVIFNTASLLLGFAIYFILWHSIPSLYDQILYLHGHISKDSFKSFLKDSFPYWLISVIGLLVLLFVFRDDLETSLAFFFSFLAAITFPHVLVIKRLNQN